MDSGFCPIPYRCLLLFSYAIGELRPVPNFSLLYKTIFLYDQKKLFEKTKSVNTHGSLTLFQRERVKEVWHSLILKVASSTSITFSQTTHLRKLYFKNVLHVIRAIQVATYLDLLFSTWDFLFLHCNLSPGWWQTNLLSIIMNNWKCQTPYNNIIIRKLKPVTSTEVIRFLRRRRE